MNEFSVLGASMGDWQSCRHGAGLINASRQWCVYNYCRAVWNEHLQWFRPGDARSFRTGVRWVLGTWQVQCVTGIEELPRTQTGEQAFGSRAGAVDP
jgi:hypothetical protein